MLVPLALVALVTAYHKTTPTATGHRPHAGLCAGPRAYLGRDVVIGGRRYHVEDVTRRGFDIWMPTRGQCRKWGRRRMHVRVLGSRPEHGVHARHERRHAEKQRRAHAHRTEALKSRHRVRAAARSRPRRALARQARVRPKAPRRSRHRAAPVKTHHVKRHRKR